VRPLYLRFRAVLPYSKHVLPIRLRGARTHNLKGVDLDIAPGEFLVLAGPSGSGKSSLALDTLYAEGQRRFVESFSPYARQFLERLPRPLHDSLDPVAPAVAVDRRGPVKQSRSNLATLTDLEPYLAALYAKASRPVCPTCNVLATDSSADAFVAQFAQGVSATEPGTVTYDLGKLEPAAYLQVREGLVRDGYRRFFVDGAVVDADDVAPSKIESHGLEVVIDRVKLGDAARFARAIETAWDRGAGLANVRAKNGQKQARRGLCCPSCARTFSLPRAGHFSYNSPLGACAPCRGFGRVIAVDWNKVIPDPSKTLAEGAVKAWTGKSAEWERRALKQYAARTRIRMDVPWNKLTERERDGVLDGEGTYDAGKFPGVRAWFKWLEGRIYKMHVRVFLARYREYVPCVACAGSRLNEASQGYQIEGLSLAAFHRLTVREALQIVTALGPTDAQAKVAQTELRTRLTYLARVGLGYLTLDRPARTLSGGEAQRAALTSALGAGLTSTLFVVDEPTTGLHTADIPPLLEVMRDLADAGNSLVVIEHDRDVLLHADRVVELGTGAGALGGTIVSDRTPAALVKDKAHAIVWGQRGLRRADDQRGSSSRSGLAVFRDLRANNVAIDGLSIPLGVLVGVAGPSGSGKSTLMSELLLPQLATSAKDFGLGAVVAVDQAPLGRTARGNAATYTHAWDRFRALFAASPEAARLGLSASHFSFNVAVKDGRGRCEVCSGEGAETVEMQFLADVRIPCGACQGLRFGPEVLGVVLRGKSVAEVLGMTVREVLLHFDSEAEPDYVLRRALTPLVQLGLPYLPLGQPLSTLSGGEAQRLKLARALAESPHGTLFVLDEPSSGLHASDVAVLLSGLQQLVAQGSSVWIVEHELALLQSCDHLIELGPGAGLEGGRVVFEGSPEELLSKETKTAAAMRGFLAPPRAVKQRSNAPHAEAVLRVEGASEHTLKHVSCEVPHGQITVVTGPSGSGKSTLAFDVIAAEGQRRFLETLSPYARQFLPTLPRAQVDRVTGAAPSIALEQRTSRAGAQSTVATVTEVSHFLRLLYAKVGEVPCFRCGGKTRASNAQTLLKTVGAMRGSITLYAPAVEARKGTHAEVFNQADRQGIKTARVDGLVVPTEPPPRLLKSKEHTIDLVIYQGAASALSARDIALGLSFGNGVIRLGTADRERDEVHSSVRACTSCGQGSIELDPRHFSSNTKQGACAACEGTGVEGGPAAVEAGESEACTTCDGTRLSVIGRSVSVGGITFAGLMRVSCRDAAKIVEAWRFDAAQRVLADAPQKEALTRLRFIEEIGLSYLSLERRASTLSGGEMQRLRLSAQLGSGLTGALYVLDEPTIGLHPRDTERLLRSMRALTTMGSTVLVVEHDEETIRAADHVIDMGPAGGQEGGRVVAMGPAARVLSAEGAPTAEALRLPRVARTKRSESKTLIELTGAKHHNLKGDAVTVQVGRLNVLAGVSGSGKSTLALKVLYPAVRKALGLVHEPPGLHKALKGAAHIKRAMHVDQAPIGRSPRSTPATYLGVWDEIRTLFASLPEAKVRGLGREHFSFNTPKGGRCKTCEGQGVLVSEMSFLPDVVSRCEACEGLRFEPAALEVKYRDMSIGEVLRLTGAEACEVFHAHPRIARPFQMMTELGVGYIQMGQGSHTLSGGEAQRLKLAAELTPTARHEATLYVLDEPTTGLHISDVRRMLRVFDALTDRGDTLVVIEHHLDVVRYADNVIELGPESGANGGQVVFQGTPEALAKAKTATGKALRAR
jgi:excinuclease ABC subunit A